MSKYVIDGDTLTDIADAIRAKNGGTEELTPAAMAEEIGAIDSNDALLQFLNGETTELISNKITTLGVSFSSGITAAILPNCTAAKTLTFAGTSIERIDMPSLFETPQQWVLRCTSLVEVNIPNCVIFGNYGVYGCTNLQRLDLPSVKTINGNRHFENCKKLTVLILRSETLVELPNDSLGNTPIAASGTSTDVEYGTGHIYVPSSIIEEYKAATNWSVYADAFRAIEDYPDICGEEAT